MGNYSIYTFLEFLGGLGIFIFGMKLMSEGVQKVAGHALRSMLAKVTNNRFLGVLSGFVITSIIQSSSATTVLIVSFVNAGLISLVQSIGVIMGANIGTTVTSWLLSTVGFSINQSMVVLPIIGLSVPLLFSGVRRLKSYGEFIVGFGLLFIGLEFMKLYVPNLHENPEVLQFVSDFASKGLPSTLLFILIGTLMTIILQSSTATIGVTIVMVSKGWIPFDLAAAMILGENIGTTVTANLAALVGNRNAKRAALAHFLFNVFGIIWCLCVFDFLLQLVDYILFSFSDNHITVFSEVPEERGAVMPIALSLFHSIFNVVNTLLLVGFVPQIVRLCRRMIPGKGKYENTEIIIGKNIIDTPEIAIIEANNNMLKMSGRSKDIFLCIKELLTGEPESPQKVSNRINYLKEKSDDLAFETSRFLKGLTQTNVSEETTDMVVRMHGMLRDFDKMLLIYEETHRMIKRKYSQKISFQRKLHKGLARLFDLTEEMFGMVDESLKKMDNKENYEKMELLRRDIIDQRDKMRVKQLERIEKKKDVIESGILYRDVYSSLERITDHLLNIHDAISPRR